MGCIYREDLSVESTEQIEADARLGLKAHALLKSSALRAR